MFREPVFPDPDGADARRLLEAAALDLAEETEARLVAESNLAAAVDRRVAAETRAAELGENLRAVYATRTFRYTRYLRKIYGLALRLRQPRNPAG